MNITKCKDMRFRLVESRYIRKLEIIGSEIDSLISVLETTKEGAVTKEDIIKQLEEIKAFSDGC